MFRPLLFALALLALPSSGWAAAWGVSPGLGVGSAPLAAGFYVAVGGSDSNPGTLAFPFLTLTRARTAMRASGTKITYIRAGTYQPVSDGTACAGDTQGSVLILAAGTDDGQTWQFYPPDGRNTAIIDGRASGNSGLGWGICSDAANLTVDGLYFKNFQISGITTKGANFLIQNNKIENITNTARTTYCIGTETALNGRILHNDIRNCTWHGIASYPNAAHGADNLQISYNFVDNACSLGADCGGIYIENKNGEPESGEVISYNYVRNIHGGGGGNHYYIDDKSSDITLTGNVALGLGAWPCFFDHGGSNIVKTGNICDISTSATKQIYTAQWISGSPTGNTFTQALVLANSPGMAGGGYPCNDFGIHDCGSVTIGPNGYHNYGGLSIDPTGTLGGGDPLSRQQIAPGVLCGWDYTLPGNSPVYASPVNFPVQPAGWGAAGFWGPPGFTVPRTGASPSGPTAC